MQATQAAKSALVHALSRLGPGARLTGLWSKSHAHLRPLADHLDLSAEQVGACPLCAAPRAVRVLAHLRFGPDHWIHEAEVHYCHACHEYSLAPQDLRAHTRASLAWARHNRPLSSLLRYGRLTAVDARLWSATPTVLNVEPTTQCNFSCWYCIGRHMQQGDLTFEDFGRILDNFPGLKMVAIVGEGEPLLNKSFYDMVRLARGRGIRVSTISNGSAFSESVVQKLCEAGLDYISISIDSINPETFAESRIGGDLNKVWRGIERLAKYRDEHGFKYPVIGLKGSLFPHTRDEMPAILAEAKRRGVDVVESFQPLNPMKSYVNIYPADKRALLGDYDGISARIQEGYASGILPSVMEFARREGLNISNSGRRNRLRPNCDEEWIYSLRSGDVTPCCQIKEPVDPDWNLTRHPVGEILGNAHYENHRFNLWNGLFPPECDGCSKTC